MAEQAHAPRPIREPDVVALQEITVRSWPLWRAALEVIGLPHSVCGLEAPIRHASRPRAAVAAC